MSDGAVQGLSLQEALTPALTLAVGSCSRSEFSDRDDLGHPEVAQGLGSHPADLIPGGHHGNKDVRTKAQHGTK